MSFGSASGFVLKKFESETEVEDKKRKRQEEWEKVRKPDDPVEAPELPEDNRSLYEKLEEQRQRKQDEYDEQHKFKNQVKGIDEDESKFLEFVADRQDQIHSQRDQEEKLILTQMKDAQVIRIEDKTADKKVKSVPSTSIQGNKKSQVALLAGAVKRKSTDEVSTSKKTKTGSDLSSSQDAASSTANTSRLESQSAQVIGVLPGLGHYDDTSDSASTSSIDSEPEFSLAGVHSVGMAMKEIKAQMQQQ